MAKLGALVIYCALAAHHTTVEEHVHEDVGGKKVPQFTEAIDEETQLAKKVPLMRLVAEGSIHHPEMREFVGIVGGVRREARTAERDARTVYDVLLFVPNKEPRWVDGVVEGSGDHEFRVIADRAPSAKAA